MPLGALHRLEATLPDRACAALRCGRSDTALTLEIFGRPEDDTGVIGEGTIYMARKIQTFLLDDGSTVAVEVEALPGEAELMSSRGEEVVEDTQKQFTQALAGAEKASREVLETFRDGLRPDTLELSFGLKFSAKAGVVLASVDAEATFALKATWIKGE